MSGFQALKNARKQRAGNTSFVSQSVPAKPSGNDMGHPVCGATSTAKMEVDEVKPVPEGLKASTSGVRDVSPTENTKEEGLYKALPQTLEIRTSKETGRGLYSTANYKPGDVIFSVKPHVAALSLSHLDGYCSSCFGAGDGSNLKRCTRCKIVKYCTIGCQTNDWAMHKHECDSLQQWMKAASTESSGEARPPSDAIRCLGRILRRMQKLGPNHIWTKEYHNMQSHRSSLPKDADPFNSEIHTHLAHGLVGYLGLIAPDQLEPYGIHSAGDLVDLISRFTTNTFTVTTPALSPLGACVAPSVALINHSCDPNAVAVFPRAGGEGSKDTEPLLQVVAIKHIQPGEEVLTSYIDTTLPRNLRQQSLKETYHFTCKCQLCSPAVGAPVDMREAMWCPKKCGGLCVLPTEQDSFTRCSKCKAVVKDTDAVLDALRIGQEALEKAERVQDSDPPKAMQLVEKLGQILQSAGLVPGAHPLLALTRLQTSLLIFKLSSGSDTEVEEVFSPQVQQQASSPPLTATEKQRGSQQTLDDAVRAATRANTGLSQVLTYGHPARGVSLAELGKLLTVDEPSPKDVENGGVSGSLPLPPITSPQYPPSGPNRLKLAQQTLVQARAELMIGFGGGKNEGGGVGKEVRKQLVDVERELGVWRDGIRNALQDLPKEKQKSPLPGLASVAR